MRVFVDTNTLLDVLARREPFYAASARIWSMAESGQIQAFISAISFNNVYYVVRKADSRKKADAAMRLLRDVFKSVAPDEQILNQAIDSGMSDFEDAVQYFSAVRARVGHLVTRNPADFPTEPIAVVSPEEFLAAIDESR